MSLVPHVTARIIPGRCHPAQLSPASRLYTQRRASVLKEMSRPGCLRLLRVRTHTRADGAGEAGAADDVSIGGRDHDRAPAATPLLHGHPCTAAEPETSAAAPIPHHLGLTVRPRWRMQVRVTALKNLPNNRVGVWSCFCFVATAGTQRATPVHHAPAWGRDGRMVERWSDSPWIPVTVFDRSQRVTIRLMACNEGAEPSEIGSARVAPAAVAGVDAFEEDEHKDEDQPRQRWLSLLGSNGRVLFGRDGASPCSLQVMCRIEPDTQASSPRTAEVGWCGRLDAVTQRSCEEAVVRFAAVRLQAAVRSLGVRSAAAGGVDRSGKWQAEDGGEMQGEVDRRSRPHVTHQVIVVTDRHTFEDLKAGSGKLANCAQLGANAAQQADDAQACEPGFTDGHVDSTAYAEGSANALAQLLGHAAPPKECVGGEHGRALPSPHGDTLQHRDGTEGAQGDAAHDRVTTGDKSDSTAHRSLLASKGVITCQEEDSDGIPKDVSTEEREGVGDLHLENEWFGAGEGDLDDGASELDVAAGLDAAVEDDSAGVEAAPAGVGENTGAAVHAHSDVRIFTGPALVVIGDGGQGGQQPQSARPAGQQPAAGRSAAGVTAHGIAAAVLASAHHAESQPLGSDRYAQVVEIQGHPHLATSVLRGAGGRGLSSSGASEYKAGGVGLPRASAPRMGTIEILPRQQGAHASAPPSPWPRVSRPGRPLDAMSGACWQAFSTPPRPPSSASGADTCGHRAKPEGSQDGTADGRPEDVGVMPRPPRGDRPTSTHKRTVAVAERSAAVAEQPDHAETLDARAVRSPWQTSPDKAAAECSPLVVVPAALPDVAHDSSPHSRATHGRELAGGAEATLEVGGGGQDLLGEERSHQQRAVAKSRPRRITWEETLRGEGDKVGPVSGGGGISGEWGCVVRPWEYREVNYVGVSASTGRPLVRSRVNVCEEGLEGLDADALKRGVCALSYAAACGRRCAVVPCFCLRVCVYVLATG